MPLHDGSDDPRAAAFATALVVGFLESACVEALRPCLEPGKATVGVRIEINRIAAKPMGTKLTAIVKLLAFDGRRLRFKVSCRDEFDLIAESFHERIITNAFVRRSARKAGAIAGAA